MTTKRIKVDFAPVIIEPVNSGYIAEVYSELQGGGEIFDFIRLKDGKVICIGNNVIGIYKSFLQYEGTDGSEDPYLACVDLDKNKNDAYGGLGSEMDTNSVNYNNL